MCKPTDPRIAKLLEDRNTTNKVLANFIRDNEDISEYNDFLLMKTISQNIKEFADILLLLTIAIHYRYDKEHIKKAVEILSIIKLEYEVWLEILKYKETWYFKVSKSIEIITIQRCLETAPNEKAAIAIYSYCLTTPTISEKILKIAVARANISEKRWTAILSNSSTGTVEEILEIRASLI